MTRHIYDTQLFSIKLYDKINKISQFSTTLLQQNHNALYIYIIIYIL